jgi:hypothetical protein
MKLTSYVIAGIVATLFAILSLGFGICHCKDGLPIYIIFAAWAVLPPLWFFFEYHYVRSKKPTQIELDNLKGSQEQAARVWAGVATALAILIMHKV